MKHKIQFFVLLFLTSLNAVAQKQSNTAKPNIDPSKPTNLYTQININPEFQDGKLQNLYGVRFNIQYALNPDNLFLVELPFLNNDRTAKFGFSDMRVRYFNAVKRNISKSFIAIAPFADVTLPTGSYKNGLGASSLSVAGGVVFGFIVSKKLSLFPGINYVHITKPATDLIPDAQKFASNGVGFQFNASYVINKQTFLFINPIPTFLSTNGSWKGIWAAELNLNRIIKPNKFKVNASWNPNFTTNVNTYRLGGTFFL